jgi:hypothetical protein
MTEVSRPVLRPSWTEPQILEKRRQKKIFWDKRRMVANGLLSRITMVSMARRQMWNSQQIVRPMEACQPQLPQWQTEKKRGDATQLELQVNLENLRGNGVTSIRASLGIEESFEDMILLQVLICSEHIWQKKNENVKYGGTKPREILFLPLPSEGQSRI